MTGSVSRVRCPSCTKVVRTDKTGLGSLHWCGSPERANLPWYMPHDKLGWFFLVLFGVALTGGSAVGIWLR